MRALTKGQRRQAADLYATLRRLGHPARVTRAEARLIAPGADALAGEPDGTLRLIDLAVGMVANGASLSPVAGSGQAPARSDSTPGARPVQEPGATVSAPSRPITHPTQGETP